MHWLSYFIWGAIGAYCFVGALVYFFQNKMLYVPQAGMDMILDPSRFGLKEHFEEHFVATTDGEKLVCWMFRQKSPDFRSCPTMLYFHSNAGNISHRLALISNLFYRLRINVFIVSYRGFWGSTGSPSEKGLKVDAETAYKYLIEECDIDKSKIVVFGRSLGGAVAIHLAGKIPENKVPAVIIENSFTSISEVSMDKFPFLGTLKLENFLINKWESIETVKELEMPLLFLSGEDDEMVPHHHMKKLHNAAEKSVDKHIEIFSEGRHMDLPSLKGYYECVGGFLNKVFGNF